MKKLIALTLCGLVIGVGSVLAQTSLPLSSWNLGTEVSYIQYKEPGIMKETGAMYGIVGSYAYHNNYMFKAEGKYSYGKVDYSSSGTGTMDDINDHMLEFRGLGGYDFSATETIVITPYTGVGYRYLYDDLRGTSSTGAIGYRRESHYFYSPIGIEAMTSLSNGWSLGATVEYDIFWMGRQRSHLGDFYAGLNTLENDQDKGYGIRGSIKIQKKMEDLNFIIEPYIKYWNIEESDQQSITYSGTPTGAVGYEPKNNSTEIGGKIALEF